MEARMAGSSTVEETAQVHEQTDRLNNAVKRAKQYISDQAQAADKVVREHPYEALGLAFGVGLLIGFLAARK